jgi:hypothetical protein
MLINFAWYQKNKYGAGYGPYYDSADGYFNLADINGDGIDDLTTLLLKMLHMELHLTRVYWFTNGTQFTHNY